MNDNASTRTTPVSVDEIVSKYQSMNREEIANETPAVISAELVILAAKLWTVGSLILTAERASAGKWVELRKTCDTDTQADRALKRTEEYAEAQKARYAEKTVVELIRSLKKLLGSKAIESHNGY